jgi:tyrosine-protein kinase Etk/Wzc
MSAELEYLDLHILFSRLHQKRWFILTIASAIFVCSMLYALCKPNIYQGSLLLRIQHKQSNVLGSSTTSSKAQPGIASMPAAPLSVQIALIKSEYILKPVIQALHLDISIHPKKPLWARTIAKNQRLVHIQQFEVPNQYMQKPLRLLIDQNQQYRLFSPKGKLLAIGSVGERLQKHKLTLLIDKLNAPAGSQFIVKKFHEAAVINRLRKRLLITDLTDAGENKSDQMTVLRISYSDRNPNLINRILTTLADTVQQQNIKLKTNEVDNALSFLQQELPLTFTSLKTAEAKLNYYRATSGRVDIKLQTQYLLSHLAEIDKEMEKLRLEKIGRLQQYTDHHPLVVSLQQETQALEHKREELLLHLKQLPASDQEAVNLTRDVEVKNNLYMILLNQIHQFQVIKTGILSDIQILTQSLPMPLPTVRLPLIGIFSLIIGLILGCVIVLIGSIALRG